MKIAVIVGSNRRFSVSRKVSRWLAPLLSKDGLQADVIDLAEIALPWLDEPELPAVGNYQVQDTKNWSEKIQAYDGVVFVFPQYNWGYPAVLKNALDTLYSEWAGKPVATVAIGSHGGFQGELALSLVLQGLKMKRLPVNLRLDIKPDEIAREASDSEAGAFLKSYEKDADLLASAFRNLI